MCNAGYYQNNRGNNPKKPILPPEIYKYICKSLYGHNYKYGKPTIFIYKKILEIYTPRNTIMRDTYY